MTRVLKEIFLDSPISWQLGFQNPATVIMENIILLHSYILMHLILVSTVVCWFLLRSIFLFRLAKNKSAMEFSHDPVIETVWTVAPVFILVSIIVPSFSLLYSMDEIIEPDITVKIVGHQWYWSYELDCQQQECLHLANKLEFTFGPTFRSIFKYTIRIVRRNPLEWTKLREWRNNVVASLNFKTEDIEAEKLIAIKLEHVKDDFTNFVWPMGLRFLTFGLGWFFEPGAKKWLHNGLNYSYGRQTKFFAKDVKMLPGRNANIFDQQTVFTKIEQMCTPKYKFGREILWIFPMIKFDSFMLSEAELSIGGRRLLEVDHRLVLPTKTHIRLLVTSADVIHSWAVPSLGVKVDALPGRLNQASITILRAGKFYGQCSELCGTNHSNMPIVIEGVTKLNFKKWVQTESRSFSLNELLESKSFEIKIKS